MLNVNGLKRNAKNIVKKYSDAQVKVREATSNDPWGPSSTLMAEVADLTYNVVAFSEIMHMIWKRLNDHGKNWRHVYKALVLLEYLIKTGTEKVASQCSENIFAIQTLKDFQYMEDNKDFGMNIREKSKKLVALLNDSEKLKAERARAIKAKARRGEAMSSGKTSVPQLASTSTIGNISGGDIPNSNSSGNNYMNCQNDGVSSSTSHLPSDVSSLSNLPSNLDSARPQSKIEEVHQIRLAMAMSMEEAEQQEKTRKNDELRLKLALDISQKLAIQPNQTSTSSGAAITLASPNTTTQMVPKPTSSAIDDLLCLNMTSNTEMPIQDDPWKSPPLPPPQLAPPKAISKNPFED